MTVRLAAKIPQHQRGSACILAHVERLERLVVHIEEGLRLAKYQDEAHLRLALLLLDSAAELLLHRAVQSKLHLQELRSQLLQSYDRAEASGHKLTPQEKQSQLELRAEVLSATKRRELERNFDAKAEFLVARGDLPEAQSRVLKKLHAYRNEAYHRDQVRPGSLRSAVRIYSYLVCVMLRDLQTWGLMITLSYPEGLKPYVGDRQPGFTTHAEAAVALLEMSGVQTQEDLGRELANHLEDRLQAMLDGLQEVVDYISSGPSSEEWDAETALALVQIEDRRGPFLTPQEARRVRVPMSMRMLRDLQARVRHLADERDQVTAFAAFADIEDAFEPVEVKLQRDLYDIDREIQLQIDIARGK